MTGQPEFRVRIGGFWLASMLKSIIVTTKHRQRAATWQDRGEATFIARQALAFEAKQPPKKRKSVYLDESIVTEVTE